MYYIIVIITRLCGLRSVGGLLVDVFEFPERAGRASTNFFTRRRRLQVSYRYSNIKTDILRLFKIKNSGKVR